MARFWLRAWREAVREEILRGRDQRLWQQRTKAPPRTMTKGPRGRRWVFKGGGLVVQDMWYTSSGRGHRIMDGPKLLQRIGLRAGM